MRDKKLIKRRLLSLFLSVLMLIGILPLNLVRVQASGGVKIDETNFPDPIVLKSVQNSFQGMNEIDSKSLNGVDILFIRNDVYFNGEFIGTFEGAKDLTGLNLFPNLNAIVLAKPNMKSIESLRGCNKLKEITIEGGSIDSFHLEDDNISSVDIRDCKINSFKLCNLENGYFGTYEKHGFISLNNCGLSNIETFGNLVLVDLLSIDNNKFTAFDLNKKIIFDLFSCKNNQIETLNFAEVNDVFLKRVDCSVNRLRNLDTSKLGALEKLNCSSNQLSRLDIGDNKALKELDCSNNGLSRLDIGNNDNLQVLNCSNNQFQGNFIADRLKGLKKLNVSNNKFTNIVFFDQNNIEELDCSNNAIPYLKNFPNLKTFKGDNQQVDVVVDRNDRRIRYKNFVLIELPQGNSKVKELSGGKLIDGSYFGEFIKVDESLPSKVTYKYEVSPGMFLDVTLNIIYSELDPTNVVSMKIKNQPTRLTYTDGEKLDLSGLVVTLEDNNGLTKDVAFADFAANGITANPTDGTALTLADNAKKVSLTKGNLTAETEALTVNEKVFDPAHVEKMIVKEQPTKLIYTEGEKLALAGLEVTLTDNQGLTKDVAFADFADNGITAAPANDTALTVDDHNGTKVTLTKGNLTAETNALTVNAKVFDPEHVESMVVKTQPTKLIYTEGEKLALAGLEVTLTDNQGLTKDVAFADFAANGITANPTDGTALTLADNATPVTLTKGSLQDETANLTVNAKVTPQDPIVGPVDPSVTPNPDEAKNWTVTFAADQTKGTIDAKNTFYVPKTAGKTLADLANDAPEVTAKAGFKFTGWNPALDTKTSINGNLTVNATFETTTTPQDPIVGPVDPSVTPNPDEAKNWTVTFAADATKGTIGAANTFYVPKTAGKTLADLANDAPEVIAKAGFMFTGWNPALDAKTSINGNMTINAEFETTTTIPKVVVPDPVNPGTVPTGRVRVTFDAGEGNTIDGTTNRYKYLDVLENTAWTDEEVTKQIPSGAKYKDNTKTFDKWDKQVPTEGNVTEETFMAIYTGKSFDLYVDTLSVGETGITVRTSIPKVKITIIKGGKVLKEAYTNDLGLSTIILDDYTKTDENYQIKGEKEGYISKKVSIKVLSI